MKRVFGFSYDERVYQSDLEPILAASRAFPEAKIYTYVPEWTAYGQVFVLAHSPEEAREVYVTHYDLKGAEAEEVKVEGFKYYPNQK